MSNTLSMLIQSGTPLIALETADEERAMQKLQEIAATVSRPLYQWSMTQGMLEIPVHKPEVPNTATPKPLIPPGKAADVLLTILKKREKGIYVFKDLGPHCRDALIHRLLRDISQLGPARKMTILLIDSLPLPEEIARFTVRFELGWPDIKELEQIVRETFQAIRDESLYEVTSNIKRKEMDQLIQTLRGLSSSEARRVVASAIYEDYSLSAADLPKIVEYKRQMLSGKGCLEAINADFTSQEIGGLGRLKAWLQVRQNGFTTKAREYGLEPPRGVLMLGVPGCGKSLCAKVVATEWGMPLLRLDPGVLYQKYIGETESQLRQALRQAESMAPVVLWIDEIEKAFASASAASSDGGLSQRMFGTLLSWMQDHRHPIFIVATANDISALPPELMRKGRFDEVFFVDLPNAAARERILGIHLTRRKQSLQQFNLTSLAGMAEHFSGSELEQVVVSGLFHAFHQNQPLRDEHLQQAIQETRPLAVLTAEKVAQLRLWAEKRCLSAD